MRRSGPCVWVAPVIVCLALACSKPKPAEEPSPLPARPLAGLAGQQVIVLPAHYVRPDTIGWASRITRQRETLAGLDSAVERALGERGFRTQWVYPAALARSARRNPGYAADPYALAAERLRPLARSGDDRLHEPLATQIRGLVALNNARYAIFPVELRFEPAASGTARPVVRVVLIDARLSNIRWQGDVRGAPVADVTPAALESVATSLADLVVPP